VDIESHCTLKGEDVTIPMNFRGEHLQTSTSNDFRKVSGRYSELAFDILNGNTLDSIEIDEVVDISVAVDCFTHVYNLENELGYYTANNLITHNCRSTIKSYEINKRY